MLNPYIWLTSAVLAYVFVSDENVAPYLVLQTKRLGLNVQRAIWMIRMHPEAPWTRYAINRRAWRIAEELQKSLHLPKEDDK